MRDRDRKRDGERQRQKERWRGRAKENLILGVPLNFHHEMAYGTLKEKQKWCIVRNRALRVLEKK